MTEENLLELSKAVLSLTELVEESFKEILSTRDMLVKVIEKLEIDEDHINKCTCR